MSRSRQLAAIMFTDIQGYTALMQQNEQQAIQARDKHRRIFNTVTEKYRGKILQYYGDGTLSIFDSALDAVKCAIDMQLGFREEPAIPVRIGIHTGEIVLSKEDIIGDSVNVAARIESLAVAGSVFISEKVYDEIKNQASIRTVRLKAFKLKNVEKPIEVYAIANEGLIVPAPHTIKGKTEPDSAAKAPEQDRQITRPPQGSTTFLTTKLFTPPSRPDIIQRPRLMERINLGLRGKLTLISAPPGFGKTTLVSAWIAGSERPAAWLSLDEGDNDPNRFLAYFIAALQTMARDIGMESLALLQSPQPPPVESILTGLLNEIAAIPQPFVLVLDDYHVITAEPVDRAVIFLLEYLPPRLHLIITTREDPPFPLSRLRARGLLTEIRVADLRFTVSEAAGFLEESMGLNLSPEDIAALETRTEGWIAGLQMAALSLQGRTDATGFVQAFTGSHRFVLDYLAEEVLQRQPEIVRDFLIKTAILNRLCGPLCDALTGRNDGRKMLETLERGNLFLIPLDDQRRWYRYHHLFADVLRVRAREEQHDQTPELHRRASVWYEQNDAPAEAIHHALAAADFARAAELIERVWPSMDGNFQSATWLHWTQALPEELVRNRPVLSFAYAMALLDGGELEAGETWLQEAERWIEPLPEEAAQQASGMVVVDEAQFRALPSSIAIARAYLTQTLGKLPETIEHARRALSLSSEEDYIRRGQAAALIGLTYWSSGDLEAAHQALADTMTYFQRAGNLQFAISVTYAMADIRITQGRLREAIRTYERSLQLANDRNGPILRGTAELYLGLGDLNREQGDLEAAAQHLLKSEELGSRRALPDWPYRIRLAKARLQEALGDSEGALQQLEEAERLYFRGPIPEVRPIAALKARLWSGQGRWEEAAAWALKRGLSVDNELSFLREFEHLTLAKILVARHRKGLPTSSPDEVNKLLERLRQAAEAGGRTGSLIGILIQQALAYMAQDDLPSALAALEQALTLAAPEGYVRIFADEGEPMAQLLSTAIKSDIMPDYASKLLAASEPSEPMTRETPHPSPQTSAQRLIEPLSQRELEILQLIARGLSNRQISERLFLALSTVKGHNQNIFAKLNVKRRTEAIARARALGLL